MVMAKSNQCLFLVWHYRCFHVYRWLPCSRGSCPKEWATCRIMLFITWLLAENDWLWDKALYCFWYIDWLLPKNQLEYHSPSSTITILCPLLYSCCCSPFEGIVWIFWRNFFYSYLLAMELNWSLLYVYHTSSMVLFVFRLIKTSL